MIDASDMMLFRIPFDLKLFFQELADSSHHCRIIAGIIGGDTKQFVLNTKLFNDVEYMIPQIKSSMASENVLEVQQCLVEIPVIINPMTSDCYMC